MGFVRLCTHVQGKKELDESGIEPETFRMQSERDNPYTTRPFFKN